MMTNEQLDEIEAQINEFGEESGFILPLIKAVREAQALLQSVALVCRGAKEPDQADLSVLGNVLRNRDEARAEVERLRGLLRTVWEDACEQEAGFLDEVCDEVEAALKEGDR